VAAAAFVFGFLSGTTIGGGILALPILMSAGLSGARLVGTDAAVGLVLHLVKVLVFGTAAILTPKLFLLGLVVGVTMVPGAYLARAALRRVPLRAHAAVMDAIVVTGGIAFIIRAFRS
jgi:uncharacterized membrane protein YfcA